MSPVSSACSAAAAPSRRRPAARCTSAGSPVGSAAATASSSRACSGRLPARLRKFSWIRAGNGSASGDPKPPASSAGEIPRGSSSSASGLPRVSATSRLATRSSNGHRTTEPSSSRASAWCRPSTISLGSPRKSAPGSRVAKITSTAFASSRRAANARTSTEGRSSHCTSSTTHTSGRSPAASDSRLSTARPTRKRSGAGPSSRPNAILRASRCGPGRRPSRSSMGPHS